MKKFLLSIFAVMLAVFSVQAEEIFTITFGTNISATSGTFLNGKLSLKCDKNSGTSAPAYNASSEELRLYYNAQGNGCSATLTTDGTIKITGIELTASSTSYTPTVKYYVDGGAAVTGTWSSTKMTISGIEAAETFKFQNANTSNKQLRIKSIKVTYEPVADAVDTAIPPTFTNSGNFVGSTMVEIKNNDDDATVYVSVDGGEYVEYEKFEIEETTTVSAYAQIGDNEETRCAPVTATYTRVAATPEISFDGDASAFENKIDVFVSTENDTPVYYTLDGSTPDAKSTLYEAPLTIKANATLKVIAIEDGGYKSGVVSQVFKKAASGSSDTATGMATLVEDAADLVVGDKVVIVGVNAGKSYALSTNQKTSNRGAVEVNVVGNSIELNSDVEELGLETGASAETFALKAAAGYLYAASSSGNQLKSKSTIDANGSWAISIEGGKTSVVATGSDNRNVMQFNYNNGSPLFACYASASQSAVSIYKVNIASIEDYVLNVSDAGWATMYLGYNVVIPEDVTCYVISGVAAESVHLEKVKGVLPANTAVIVEAKEGDYTFAVTEETAGVENVMEGTLNNEYITKEAYVLGYVNIANENEPVNMQVGLYKAEMAGGVWLNNANKAYLPASAVPNKSAAFYGFDWDGTTGIENVEVENADAVKGIYDLTGRRIDAITAPGIYIVNGVKKLVR